MNEITIQENIPSHPIPANDPRRATRNLVFRDRRMIQSCPFLSDDDFFIDPKGNRLTGKAGDFLIMIDYAFWFVIDSKAYDILFRQTR